MTGQKLQTYGIQVLVTIVALVLAFNVVGSLQKNENGALKWRIGSGSGSDGGSDSDDG